MEWKPIETAPKDCEILVYNGVTGVYKTKHDEGHWPMCGWGNAVGLWFPVPTHWMPLPPAPKVAAEACAASP